MLTAYPAFGHGQILVALQGTTLNEYHYFFLVSQPQLNHRVFVFGYKARDAGAVLETGGFTRASTQSVNFGSHFGSHTGVHLSDLLDDDFILRNSPWPREFGRRVNVGLGKHRIAVDEGD